MAPFGGSFRVPQLRSAVTLSITSAEICSSSVETRTNSDSSPQRSRMGHRTSQLPVGESDPLQDRALHGSASGGPRCHCDRCLARRRDFDSRLPKDWVAAFELSASAATLIMVFAIQHTQGREQAATQRRLDEVIRASPGANESLMLLEESPREFMLDIDDEQRETRSNSSDADNG